MLVMIANHYLSGSGLAAQFDVLQFSWRVFFYQCVCVWGKALINTFALITGYFMCKRSLTAGQWTRLFLRGKFYLIVFLCIFPISGALNANWIFQVFFPEILGINQGFAYSFLVFYLLIPFCNKLLEVVDEKELKTILALAVLIYAVPAWLGNKDTFNYVAWYVVVYLMGAYIRLYPKPWMRSRRFCLNMLCISVLCAWISIAVIDVIGPRYK